MQRKKFSISTNRHKVTPRQIAGAIGANLKDFRYSYENRRVERESAEKILNAIRELQPPKDGGK